MFVCTCVVAPRLHVTSWSGSWSIQPSRPIMLLPCRAPDVFIIQWCVEVLVCRCIIMSPLIMKQACVRSATWSKRLEHPPPPTHLIPSSSLSPSRWSDVVHITDMMEFIRLLTHTRVTCVRTYSWEECCFPCTRSCREEFCITEQQY